MNGIFEGSTGEKLRKVVLAAVSVLTLFLIALSLQAYMGLRYVGAGIPASNTITVSGEGEVYAVPDTGSFTYAVVSDKTTVAAAQADATAKSNDIVAYLKGAGVDEKDIQTTDYSISPRYEWQNSDTTVCSGGYCPPSGKQVLIGYEVSQSNSVKVRDTSKAGDLLAGIGSHGATSISGLSFTVDDPTAIQAEARDKAIADAKSKATTLAKSLGVSLVRVVSFNESTGGVPVPMYAYASGMGGTKLDAASAPTISTGQNKMTSNVSVTYEIR